MEKEEKTRMILMMMIFQILRVPSKHLLLDKKRRRHEFMVETRNVVVGLVEWGVTGLIWVMYALLVLCFFIF